MAVPEFYSGKLLYPAIAVLIGLSALFGLAILPRLAPRDGGLTGKAAPDVSLPIVHNGEPGARISLSGLVGQAVVLDFWATHCGPCAFQAPIVDRIARRHEKKGLVVIGVNVDEPAEVASRYAVQKGLSFPIAIDETGQASESYGVRSIPTLVVIDRKGNVVAYVNGVVDEGQLEEMVAAAL
jgi:cytochrome c biogenesis protein CcmG, thiol:disulfide interchange protein DsbE